MAEDTKAQEATTTENTTVEETQTSNTVSLPAFFGVKAGMTRIFDESGNHVPVTVVKLIPNVVSQVKTKDTDGYEAYQVAFGEKREKLGKKPQKGHLAKAKVDKTLTRFAELRSESVDATALGKELSLENFGANTYVDVTGTSKGKGFQGVIKKFGFQGGPKTHGSQFHRAPGSIGQCATPARVFKQKKMPGHMGDKTTTVQNIKIVELNTDKGYILLKGSIPGAKNGFLRVSQAVKRG
ncbi:MAG: 50S ribosomal protein L3 [Bacteriovoracaceae bacterium]|nr:50S ribosomal protein L3 [Bacteriovoracaceae bacterium]